MRIFQCNSVVTKPLLHSTLRKSLQAGGTMKYRVAVMTLCGLAFSTGPHAENPFRYDAETTLTYARIGETLTVFEVDVQRYFETVDTQSRPLAEAAFLQHASQTGVTISSLEIDRENDTGNQFGLDTGLRYVLDGVPLVLTAKVGWATSELGNSDVNRDTVRLGAGAGAYVTQATYLGAEFSITERTLSSPSGARDVMASTATGINVKSVFTITDELALTMTARGTKTKFKHDNSRDSNALDLALDVYVTRAASIGIETADEHRSAGSDLRVRAIALRWFFVPQASVSFEFGRLTDNDPAFTAPQKHQVYALGLTGRM